VIDAADPQAVIAEAARRTKLRAEGKRFDAPDPENCRVPHINQNGAIRQLNRQPADGMNQTERRRSIELEALKRTGEIRDWRFESLTLVLAPGLRYTPDFLVTHLDGALELEEIKGGYIRDDAKAKYKVAPRLFPMFRWTLRQWKDGRWHVTELKP
jgi:hypothetical protein